MRISLLSSATTLLSARCSPCGIAEEPRSPALLPASPGVPRPPGPFPVGSPWHPPSSPGNPFARFRFKSNADSYVAVKDGWRSDQTKFAVNDEESKHITGALLNDVNADVLCLQEVEGFDVLKRFRSQYLGGHGAYPYGLVIDGNDPRRIDVAVLSKLPIVSARSWQRLPYGRGYVFSRDCLECDVEMPDGSLLTVYNNHFKSIIGGRGGLPGLFGAAGCSWSSWLARIRAQ